MAWTAPITWSTGQLVAAADLNAQIRDNMTLLKVAVDANGKIYAINSTYFASLDGSALTGVAKLAANNDFTAGVHNYNAGTGTRLVLPTGANKWAS